MASLSMTPSATLHRDGGVAEASTSGVQLRRNAEFQCKVAKSVRGRGNLSTSRVEQEVRRSVASRLNFTGFAILYSWILWPFWCPGVWFCN